jgi:glutathione S-transferase
LTRRVVPADPVLALIDRLLEDYGDEWLTKAMFHYRWVYDADILRSAQTLPHWRAPAQSDEKLAELGDQFAARQIGRLGVVGSNAVTGPVIEASYLRFIELMNTHLQSNHFIFGSRPSATDFALFGQLTCLAQFDPTPMKATFETGGRIYAWVSMMEDQSGLNVENIDWMSIDQLPDAVHAMLTEMGRTYVPVMLANERAIANQEETVYATVDGKPWEQRPFPYQAKCVRWLRDARDQLSDAEREQFDSLIAGTGLDALFAAG